jgi:hypothetical protein
VTGRDGSNGQDIELACCSSRRSDDGKVSMITATRFMTQRLRRGGVDVAGKSLTPSARPFPSTTRRARRLSKDETSTSRHRPSARRCGGRGERPPPREVLGLAVRRRSAGCGTVKHRPIADRDGLRDRLSS